MLRGESTMPYLLGALVTFAALIYSIAKGIALRREARTMPEDSRERRLSLTAGLFLLEPLGTLAIMFMLSCLFSGGLQHSEISILLVLMWVPLPWVAWSLVLWPWLRALSLRDWGLFKLGMLGLVRGSVFIVVPVSVQWLHFMQLETDILFKLPMIWALSMVFGFLGLLMSCVWVPRLSAVDELTVQGLAKQPQVEAIGLERRAES